MAPLGIREDDGAPVGYDAATFDDVKRIPMREPVGTYDVCNTIPCSAGTRH